MSLSSRRVFLATFVLVGGLSLTGCLQPMLATNGPAGRLLGQIALPSTDDRFRFFLNDALSQRLGRAGSNPAFELNVSTTLSQQGVAIAQDNSVTRITLTGSARWDLIRRADSKIVLSDIAQTQSGYNATTSLFATRQTRLDIERRIARDLGERIARVILGRAREIKE